MTLGQKLLAAGIVLAISRRSEVFLWVIAFR
jgi:hypothetical protein